MRRVVTAAAATAPRGPAAPGVHQRRYGVVRDQGPDAARSSSQVLTEDEFRDWPNVGIVIQCYLRDAGADLVGLRDWAPRRGTPGVGAAGERGVLGLRDDPRRGQRLAGARVSGEVADRTPTSKLQRGSCCRNHEHLRPALGTHNIRSLAHGIAVARQLGLPPAAFELQMLYGMADAEKQALVELGHRLRIYMPYGELIPGMAYLVRRLLENTSNDSFLRAGFADNVPADELLRNPWTVSVGRISNPSETMTAHQTDGLAIRPTEGRRFHADHPQAHLAACRCRLPQRAAGRFRQGREPRGDASRPARGRQAARPALSRW